MAHRFSRISGLQDFREPPGEILGRVKALGEFCQPLKGHPDGTHTARWRQNPRWKSKGEAWCSRGFHPGLCRRAAPSQRRSPASTRQRDLDSFKLGEQPLERLMIFGQNRQRNYLEGPGTRMERTPVRASARTCGEAAQSVTPRWAAISRELGLCSVRWIRACMHASTCACFAVPPRMLRCPRTCPCCSEYINDLLICQAGSARKDVSALSRSASRSNNAAHRQQGDA